MKPIQTFDQWWTEVENFSMRGERLCDVLTKPSLAQIAYDEGVAAALATQPQAPQGAEAKRLREALVCTREALEHANNMKGGPIIDTIWYDASETLFDYIDSVLAAPKTETPEGEQV